MNARDNAIAALCFVLMGVMFAILGAIEKEVIAGLVWLGAMLIIAAGYCVRSKKAAHKETIERRLFKGLTLN